MIENESILEARIKNGSRSLEDYRLLGKTYLDRGDYNKLIRLYEQASTLPSSSEEKALMLHEKGLVS